MATATLGRQEKVSYADPLPAKKPAGKAAVCDGRERAPTGFKRFKVRAEYPPHTGPKYILATDEQAARQEYLKVMGLDVVQEECKAARERWKQLDKGAHLIPEPNQVVLVVKELED